MAVFIKGVLTALSWNDIK